MTTYSISELSRLSGKDRRTITKRLENVEPVEGKYTFGQVLDAFESHGADISDKLDLNQQTARLRKLQADVLERRKQEEEGTVKGSIPLEDCNKIMRALGGLLMVRARLFWLGEVNHFVPDNRDLVKFHMAESIEGAFKMGLETALAEMEGKIPKAVRDGLIEGVLDHTSWTEAELLEHARALNGVLPKIAGDFLKDAPEIELRDDIYGN